MKSRSRGNRFGFRVFDIFISLGVGHAYAFLRFVALHYLLFDSKLRASMRWYVDAMWLSPPLPKRLFLIYKLIVAAGEKLVDLRVLKLGTRDVSLACETNEMRELVAEGKGLIFFTSHVGNWQLMMEKLPDFGVDVSILKRPETNQTVEEFLKIDEARSKNRVSIIDASDGLKATLTVLGELEKGNIVSIMGDAPAPGGKTSSVDFLGQSVELPEWPFRIAASSSAPIISLFAKKTGKCEYALTSALITTAPGRDDLRISVKEKARRLAVDYTAALEAFLRANPFEWTPGGRL